MRKLLFIAFLLVSPFVFSQETAEDSVVVDTYDDSDDIEMVDYQDNENFVDSKFSPVDTSDLVVSKLPALRDKYNGKDFDYTKKEVHKTLWERFLEWLASLFRWLFGGSNERALNSVDLIVKILGVLLFILVVFLIVRAIMNKEGSWIFGRSASRKILGADEIEKEFQQADFGKLVSEARQSGDHRLAIRYYYLWLLRRLSDRGMIRWDKEKTNSDYLYELSNPAMREEFSYLSYLYNHIWYGEFEADAATFEKAGNAFEKTIRSI